MSNNLNIISSNLFSQPYTRPDWDTFLFKRHPISQEWPNLYKWDLYSLCSSIREHGLDKPIILYNGQISDGAQRLKACLLEKVEPIFTDYLGTEDELRLYVREVAHKHRNPTKSQISAVATLGMIYGLTGIEPEPLLVSPFFGSLHRRGNRALGKILERTGRPKRSGTSSTLSIFQISNSYNVSRTFLRLALKVFLYFGPSGLRAVHSGEASLKSFEQGIKQIETPVDYLPDEHNNIDERIESNIYLMALIDSMKKYPKDMLDNELMLELISLSQNRLK